MTPALTALLAVPEVQPLYERVFNSMPGSCIPDNAVWRQNKADLDALLTAIVAARDAMLADKLMAVPLVEANERARIAFLNLLAQRRKP